MFPNLRVLPLWAQSHVSRLTFSTDPTHCSVVQPPDLNYLLSLSLYYETFSFPFFHNSPLHCSFLLDHWPMSAYLMLSVLRRAWTCSNFCPWFSTALFSLLKKSKALGLPFDIQIALFDKTVKNTSFLMGLNYRVKVIAIVTGEFISNF